MVRVSLFLQLLLKLLNGTTPALWDRKCWKLSQVPVELR
jgi:hypothetical protein